MTDAPQTLLTVDEFLAQYAGRKGKWELHDGVVANLAPAPLGHRRTKLAAVNALAAAIRRASLPCQALPDSIGVRVSARSAYIPDALVYCGPRLGDDTLEISNPIVVVEALSSSTADYDETDKLAGYFSLPSVMHYLILNPRTRRGVHHKRGNGEVIETRILREGALRLDPPGLELDVADLFAPE